MREILFRGKRVDNGKWITGYYFHYETCHEHFIITDMSYDMPDMEQVIPETVGQYTGLTDKNGKKIFEGDIVQYDKDGATYEIVFAEDCGITKFCSRFIPDGTLGYVNQRRDKVIGNRWDNPELLQE